MVPSLFLIRLLRTSKPKSVDVESLYGITRQRVHSSLGKSPEDFTRVMLDMADGARFTTADEKHRESVCLTMQCGFLGLMNGYLP